MTTIIIIDLLILCWFVCGAIIIFYHYKVEYASVYSFWEGILLSILWSWFGCAIILFDIADKLYFWKNKNK